MENFRENKSVEELLKSKEKPEDVKSLARILSEVAAELGEDISQEAFMEALEENESAVRQRTDTVILRQVCKGLFF